MPWIGAAIGAGVSLLGDDNDEAEALTREQIDINRQSQQIANEQWAEYKQTYQPLERDFVAAAREGLKPNFEGVTAGASADVKQAFAKGREATGRNLASYGLNPSSTRFAALERQSAVDEAAAEAGAINRARTTEKNRVEDTNWNRMSQAVGLGKGMPSQAQAGLSSASAGLGSAANSYNQMAQQEAQGAYNLAYSLAGLTRSPSTQTAQPALLGPPNAGEQGDSGYFDSQDFLN